jgi:hypothetical protein
MSKFILYKQGGGSSEIQLVDEMPQNLYHVQKRAAIRYLETSHAAPGTIEMLEQVPFRLWQARNDFGDNFEVLYTQVGMSTFVDIENEVGIWRHRIVDGCPAVATAFQRIGHPLRFIAVGLDLDEQVSDVSPPVLAVTSEVVEEALHHAETLIANHGAASGLDRAHTAMHAYLLSASHKAGILVKDGAGITDLFARLREQHPALIVVDEEEKSRLDQILRGMARIVDALDPLRNRKSLAHPNKCLGDAEAMLAINLIRTMLRYLDTKLR